MQKLDPKYGYFYVYYAKCPTDCCKLVKAFVMIDFTIIDEGGMLGRTEVN